MQTLLTERYLDVHSTRARALFARCKYPWEALPLLRGFLTELGGRLPPEQFDHPADGIWIARSARVAPQAILTPPCIVDENAELRPGALIRGSVLIGRRCVVGNSTELKNSILFDEAALPHFNYGGDSVFGFRAHLGAGAVTSNVRCDRGPVYVRFSDELRVPTNLRKFGAVVGDFAEIGCNSVLNPGSMIGRGSTVYPLSCFRGVLAENVIYKSADETVRKWD